MFGVRLRSVRCLTVPLRLSVRRMGMRGACGDGGCVGADESNQQWLNTDRMGGIISSFQIIVESAGLACWMKMGKSNFHWIHHLQF